MLRSLEGVEDNRAGGKGFDLPRPRFQLHQHRTQGNCRSVPAFVVAQDPASSDVRTATRRFEYNVTGCNVVTNAPEPMRDRVIRGREQVTFDATDLRLTDKNPLFDVYAIVVVRIE